MKLNKYNLEEYNGNTVCYLADSQYYEVREGELQVCWYHAPCFYYKNKYGKMETTAISNKSELFTEREEAVKYLTDMLLDKIAKAEKQVKKLTNKMLKLNGMRN